MLKVTLNETEIINNALHGEYDSDNIIIVIDLLIKYYYTTGITNKLLLKENILEFLKKNYKNYKRAKWEETIHKHVIKFFKLINNGIGIFKKKKMKKGIKILKFKNNYRVHISKKILDFLHDKPVPKIINIKEIHITKSELGSIQALDDIKLEKIAFIMLIYAKISNIISDNKTDGWINQSCSIICKEAKVNLKGTDKIKIFNNLYEKEYIKQRKNNSKTNMKVNYIDEDSETEMIINDFDNIIYKYILWKNKDMIACCNCSKPIKVKNNKTKYCKNCAGKIWYEKHKEVAREGMRKKREIKNVD